MKVHHELKPIIDDENLNVKREKYSLWFETLSYRSHLKVPSDVKCYSSGGVDHIKNGEVKTESQHPRTKNNDEGRPRIWMSI
jgi:hypothetical protein